MDKRYRCMFLFMCIFVKHVNSGDYGRCIILDHLKTWTAILQVRFDCSSRGLKEIPIMDVPKFESQHGITHVFLQKNKIDQIKLGVFNHTRFKFLTYLDLSDNPIRFLADGAFEGLTNLTNLNIRNDFVVDVDMGSTWRGVFSCLYSLQTLKVPTLKNQTQELSAALMNMEDLKSISLVLAVNMTIPYGIDTLPKLQKLEFTKGGPLEELRFAINGNMSKITSLSFAWADIHRIPHGLISNFTNLDEFVLSGNSRLNISHVLGLLDKMPGTHLKRLSMDHVNKNSYTLKNHDFNITSLRNLTHLTLRANNIITMHMGFIACLPRLQYLALGFNLFTTIDPTPIQNDFFSFTAIPVSFRVPNNLAVIDLSNRFATALVYDQIYSDSTGYFSNDFFSDVINFFYEVDSCRSYKTVIVNGTRMFINLACLQVFTYTGQYLTATGQLVPFHYSNTLRYLDVSYAQEVQTTVKKLNPMPRLEYLDMCCSGILSVDDDLLVNTPNLTILHMAHNQLGRGSNNLTALFRFQSKLRELYMKDNYLVYIPQDAFFNLTSLHTLDLTSNQFTVLDIILSSTKFHFLDLKHNVLSGDILTPDTRQSILNHTTNSSDIRISLYPYIGCTCQTIAFDKWVHSTEKVRLDLFRFYLNCSISGREMDYKEGISYLRKSNECWNPYLEIIIGLSCLLVVVLIVASFTYRYRIYLKWIYYTARQNVFGLQLQSETTKKKKVPTATLR